MQTADVCSIDMNHRAVRYPSVGWTEVTLAENIQSSDLFCSEKSEKIETYWTAAKMREGACNNNTFFRLLISPCPFLRLDPVTINDQLCKILNVTRV